jgi:hypothetical protein
VFCLVACRELAALLPRKKEIMPYRDDFPGTGHDIANTN